MRSIADGIDELLDVDDARRLELHRVELLLVEQDVLVLRHLEAPHQVRALDGSAGLGIDRLHADAMVGLGIDQVEVHVGAALGRGEQRHRAGHEREPQMALPGRTLAASASAFRHADYSFGIDQRLDGLAQRHRRLVVAAPRLGLLQQRRRGPKGEALGIESRLHLAPVQRHRHRGARRGRAATAARRPSRCGRCAGSRGRCGPLRSFFAMLSR